MTDFVANVLGTVAGNFILHVVARTVFGMKGLTGFIEKQDG